MLATDPHHHRFDGSFLFPFSAHRLRNSLTYGHNNKFDGDELLLLAAVVAADEQLTSLFSLLVNVATTVNG